VLGPAAADRQAPHFTTFRDTECQANPGEALDQLDSDAPGMRYSIVTSGAFSLHSQGAL